MLPFFSIFLNTLAVRSCHFFYFPKPLGSTCSTFFRNFAFHIPDHAGHARSRRRASACRDEVSLVYNRGLRVLCVYWRRYE